MPESGHAVLTPYRSEELVEALKSQFGAECNYMLADFTKLADVHVVGRQLSALDGNIDVLIHNAGVYVTRKRLTADNIVEYCSRGWMGVRIREASLNSCFTGQTRLG